ncbi:MAG: hypothetical protein LLG06_17050 [Desulfobacteraceae bacterium]|nr:hypothetical protein [Desulfobacteraceae bacterium]
MTTDADLLRRHIGKLYIDRTVGDVTERVFQRKIAEKTVDLYRAVIAKRLAEGEEIKAEHHTLSSHFRVTQSVLKEPEQHATSLFLTNLRLLQLTSTIFPGQPPTADARDATVVDELALDRMREVRPRAQIRWGEAAVGAVMCAIGGLFFEELSLTGPVLVLLGGLGIFHATLMPGRWVEIWADSADGESRPMVLYAVRKKSARQMLMLLRERARENGAREDKSPAR